jgi:hypothetical protein
MRLGQVTDDERAVTIAVIDATSTQARLRVITGEAS